MIFLGSKGSQMQNREIIVLKYFLSIQENEINWIESIKTVIKLGFPNEEFLGYWSDFFLITWKQR